MGKTKYQENFESEEDKSEALPKKTKISSSGLEKIYDETAARIQQDRNDFLLAQIHDFVQTRKWINLTPEYQRRRRWDDRKQSRLIESLLMNVPVPPVFLYEMDLNRYEVMDGQQRLSSILDFYSNKLTLRGLRAWPELNGLNYKKLPARLQRGLDRRRISAVTLLLSDSGAGSGQLPFNDIRREVFERLNTGGTALNHQELRNCIYGGPFNDLIVELASSSTFCTMWGIPKHSEKLTNAELGKLQENELFSKMADCQIVLRYFAFRETEYVKGSVKRMLDNVMIRHQSASKAQIKDFRSSFTSRLSLIHQIFGKDAFCLPQSRGGRHSRPLFDALMIVFDRLWDQRAKLKAKRAKLRAALNRLLDREKSYAVLIGRPNTAKDILLRISLVERAFKSEI